MGVASNGLVNMHKRMASIQGHCELLSQLNDGTKVKLTIPFHTK
jgi:signal transduction histidine kinase